MPFKNGETASRSTKTRHCDDMCGPLNIWRGMLRSANNVRPLPSKSKNTMPTCQKGTTHDKASAAFAIVNEKGHFGAGFSQE